MATKTARRYDFGPDTPDYESEVIASVPERMLDAIERYVQTGCPIGDFLTAVIDNDLRGAVGRADDENLTALHDIVKVFHNYCPADCWGAAGKRTRWQNHQGLSGLQADD